MKKCLMIAFILSYPCVAYTQCTPSSTTIPGVTPSAADNLPIAYAGTNYSTVIQVRTPLDTSVNGTYATLTRVQINGISNLPAGFSYTCNPSNCMLGPLSNGCMNITGNPTGAQAGTYLIDIDITVSGKLYGVIPVTQSTKISDYKIKIVKAPVANFYLSEYNICQGDKITFSDQSTNYPTSWLWTFPGGTPSSSTLENPIVTYAQPGVYDVTLKATSPAGLGKKTKTAILTVGAKPNADLVSYLADTICNGDSSLIEALPVNNSTYRWFKNGSLINGAQDYFYYARTEADYSVEVTKTSSGCSALSHDKHIKNVKLNSTIASVGATTLCAPGTVTLKANSNGNFAYTWYKNNAKISGASASTYIAPSTGNYKVKIQNARGCAKTSVSLPVTIYPIPSSGITASGPLVFCQGDNVTLTSSVGNPSGKTFQWKRNNVDISGETGQSYKASQQGYYKVNVTNPNGCSTNSLTKHVVINCRIENNTGGLQSSGSAILVSPNPCVSDAIISMELYESAPVEITIMDALGKIKTVVTKTYMDAGEHEFNLNTSGYASGIYLVKAVAGNEIKTTRLLVKN